MVFLIFYPTQHLDYSSYAKSKFIPLRNNIIWILTKEVFAKQWMFCYYVLISIWRYSNNALIYNIFYSRFI